MVENGSSGGVRPVPPDSSYSESHAEFLELCAIATTGSLTAEEQARLSEHLMQCALCRDRIAQYEAVIAGAIPAMAPSPSLLKDGAESPNEWSPGQLDRAEEALFARLNDDEDDKGPTPAEVRATHISNGDALWRHMWWQYAAGLLLSVAIGGAVYRVGVRHGTENARLTDPAGLANPAHQQRMESQASQSEYNPPRIQERRPEDAENAVLRTQLADRSAELARLKGQQAQMQKELDGREADGLRLAQERTQAARQLQAVQADLEEAQRKLDAATGVHLQDVSHANALERQISQLTDTLHGREQELARQQELLDHDRDIRELMGSRDLYVADVIDVAKTGDTKKAFGRVFYAKDKSLKFYAYDLAEQEGGKNAGTFQVWGRRGPDQGRAVSLGVLFEDNASKKRWVMKSNNAKTMSEIDAVFVTKEPDGGSQHPSGKPLLFAYLKVEPNHP